MSEDDISKGKKWSIEISSRLEAAKFGIVCLTPENLEAPWIQFEAGALSKTLASAFVCPYLLDLVPSQMSGPLVQFQATRANKDETMALLATINSAIDVGRLKETTLKESFEMWWPELENSLGAIQPVNTSPKPKRSEMDLLEEILQIVREQSRVADNTSTINAANTLVAWLIKDQTQTWENALKDRYTNLPDRLKLVQPPRIARECPICDSVRTLDPISKTLKCSFCDSMEK